MTCLIVSVERTVDMPSLLPSKEANVLLPVPEVPANKIRIFLLDSIKNVNLEFRSYRQDLRQHRNP